MIQGQAQVLLNMLVGFMPLEMRKTPEILAGIASECTQAQFTHMQQMLQGVLDEQRRASAPFWGVFMRMEGQDFRVIAPKRFEACQSNDERLHYLIILGLVAAPLLRAVLVMNKVALRFVEVKSWPDRPPPPKKLHLVGG
jgi:hypothetical protein